MNKKQNKGITLVALVITIIVLLILAGVSINAIQNGGIIKNATDAKNNYQDAKKEEETKLIDLEVETDFLTKVTQGYKSGLTDISKNTPYLFKNGYLSGVEYNVDEPKKMETVSSFKNKLPEGYTVFDKDNISEITAEKGANTTKVGTGMILKKKISDDKFETMGRIIVYGDITGDGQIDSSDFTELDAFNEDNTSVSWNEWNKIAADCNFDEIIDEYDVPIISNHFASEEESDLINQKHYVSKDLTLPKDKATQIKELAEAYVNHFSNMIKYNDSEDYQIHVLFDGIEEGTLVSVVKEALKLEPFIVEVVGKNDSDTIATEDFIKITHPDYPGKEILEIYVEL